MAQPRVLILRAAGTNCDLETAYAWEQAGAVTESLHVRTLIDDPARLPRYEVLTLPGGFSYGDDISAGRILAAQVERHVADELYRFVEAGKLVLGICNGFQVLVKLGLLPSSQTRTGWRDCTITYNDPRGFQDRWVRLRAGDTPCAFLERGRHYELPIAHGEGRVVFSSEAVLETVHANGRAALTYAEPAADGGMAGLPRNPNASERDIAGLCDETGRVFGLMPHPERFIDRTQHPCWTSRPAEEAGDGLAMFRQAVAHFD